MNIEELRMHFRKAKDFIALGNPNNVTIVIASITAISDYVREIYRASTVVYEKAKCRALFESCDLIINIIKTKGISDERVLAFFGLAPSTVETPSFTDLMNGKTKKITSIPTPSQESGQVSPSCKNINDYSETKKPISVEKNEEDPSNKLKISMVEKETPMYTPNSLHNFIGQQHIVKTLLKEIAIAKNKGLKHLDNILLFGNPGLGKTTLMELIAKELGVKFEKLDCSQFRNSQQSLKMLQNFLLRVAKDNKPVVIALDEIHTLTSDLQHSLLTLLNDRVYVSPPDITGNIKRIPIEEFTFIGATTDDDKVLDTIKNRCLRLTFQMIDYSPEELKQIYLNKIAAKGLSITEETLEICIPRSRGAIRYVNSIVEGLDNALYNDKGIRISTHIDRDVALNYFEEKEIDPIGLGKKDLEILHTLYESVDHTMGVDALAARVGLETKKYISEYEKYLLKIGFIDIIGKGRCLTDNAIKYICGNDDNLNELNENDGISNDIVDDLFGEN